MQKGNGLWLNASSSNRMSLDSRVPGDERWGSIDICDALVLF